VVKPGRVPRNLSSLSHDAPRAPGVKPDGRPGLRARIQYRWDTVLSRGTWTIIVWLAAVTGTFILVTAFILTLFRVTFGARRPVHLPEAAWQSLLRVIDPGTMAGDSGWPLRLVALTITIAGIFLASALIGIIATGIDTKIVELRKGRSFVIEQNHTVLLGWSPRLFTIVSELVMANENHPGLAVVVLADRDKTQMEDEIKARVGPLGKTRLVCRTGDPASITELDIVNVDHARAIVALGEGGGAGDAQVVKTVLAVRAEGTLDRVPVIAEMTNENTARALRHACGGRVLTVRSSEVVARITAQACRQSGLSFVFEELLDFEGDEIYFAEVPALAGHTFGEALLAFEDSSPIGMKTSEGNVVVNPPMDSIFREGDSVIAISEDDDTVVFTGFVEHNPAPPPKSTRVVPATEHLLVVGWNHLGPLVLDELDHFVAPGSSVDIVADAELVAPQRLALPPFDNLKTSITPTAEDVTDDLAALARQKSFTSVVIFGYREGLTPDEADARTLLTLLLIERVFERSDENGPRVVAELLDARDVELARITGADDYVVSDALASLMMAQLAEHPDLREVFEDLFDADGCSIHMADPGHYLPLGETHSYGHYVAAARNLGQVAIGYRLAAGPQDEPVVAVNPLKSERVELGHDDYLIIVGS
jgi:voltage-gated potassium channel Kch